MQKCGVILSTVNHKKTRYAHHKISALVTSNKLKYINTFVFYIGGILINSLTAMVYGLIYETTFF